MSLNISAVENLNVSLEHDIDEQYQYQPGEILRGQVQITLFRDTLIQTIYITVHGEGAVAWEDEYYGGFQANEIYINASKVIVDKHNAKPLYLKKGFHEFDFEYQIPYDVPSSFIGKYGSVTYVLKAIVQGEKSSDTSITSEPFLVLARSPLPEESSRSSSQTVARRFWKGCSFGKLKIKVGLNRTGGVPGEDFFIYAEVANKSPLRVTAIQGALIMNSAYNAQKKTIEFRQIINKRRDEQELLFGDGRKWQNVRLTVPPYIPESKLDRCDIIEVQYVIEFRVEISGGREIVVEFPILIGAVPAGLELLPNEYKSESNPWRISGYNSHVEFDALDSYKHGHSDWDAGVPELRHPDSTVSNPLYEQDHHHHHHHHGHQNHNGHYRKHNKHHHDNHHQNLEDLPEIIQNTKL